MEHFQHREIWRSCDIEAISRGKVDEGAQPVQLSEPWGPTVARPNTNRMSIATKDQKRKTYKVAIDRTWVTGLRRGGGESGVKVTGSSKV